MCINQRSMNLFPYCELPLPCGRGSVSAQRWLKCTSAGAGWAKVPPGASNVFSSLRGRNFGCTVALVEVAHDPGAENETNLTYPHENIRCLQFCI